MKPPQPVIALDDPALQPYRTLRRSAEHITSGIFVAEGEKVVRRLLNSLLGVRSFLLTESWFDILKRSEKRFKTCGARVYIAPKELMREIVGYRLHQGIMAVGVMPENPSLPELVSTLRRPSLLVALDALMNSENVGVIVRNCAGFGVDAIIVGEKSSSPYLRRAVRNSMGAVFSIPVFHSRNIVADLKMLKEQGIVVAGADVKGNVSISETDLRGDLCIALGNEESGISQAVLDLCTLRITIPMENNTDSLNVSSASAVFMYEAATQRSRSG